MININNSGTWNQMGDIVDGDKIMNGISQDDLNRIKECAKGEDVSKEGIAALVSVLKEINASQNDLTTEFAYMASIERDGQKSGILKKLQEKLTFTNGVISLVKTIGEIGSKNPEMVGEITGFLSTLL